MVAACGQRRLWSDWADAQADLNLRWALLSYKWNCPAFVQILCYKRFICVEYLSFYADQYICHS